MGCPGKKKIYGSNAITNCGGTVYKCTKCNSVGCTESACTNRCFESSRCLKCGANGTKKSI